MLCRLCSIDVSSEGGLLATGVHCFWGAVMSLNGRWAVRVGVREGFACSIRLQLYVGAIDHQGLEYRR